MANKKYIHQTRYAERNKDKIALSSKKRYLNKEIEKKGILDTPIIQEYIDESILEDAKKWYLHLDAKYIRGYTVEVKFKTILYLLFVYKERIPVFYQEFEINPPVKRTQGLKEKLIREYYRIYEQKLHIIPLHFREYLPRFMKQFGLTVEQEFLATQIITKTGRHFKYTNPKTYLGSVIYEVTKGSLTQRELADFLQITPNGIRGIIKKLKKYL